MHRRLGFSFLYFTPRVRDEHHRWLARLAHHGYDGAELPVVEATEAELAAMRRALDAEGLAATAVGFATPDANPLDPDPAVRRAAVEHLGRLAERSAALGADVLAGPLHSAYGVFTEQPPSDDERARCVDVLRAAAERADEHGVTLALEPLNRFECYFLNTAADCAALVRAVGHPRLVGALDTHHAHIEEADVAAAIAAMGAAGAAGGRSSHDAERAGSARGGGGAGGAGGPGTLGHVQLSENHRGTPGAGQVDFGRVLAALDRIGYDRWLVIEAFSRQDPDLGSALRIWRALDGGAEEVLAAGAAVARGCG